MFVCLSKIDRHRSRRTYTNTHFSIFLPNIFVLVFIFRASETALFCFFFGQLFALSLSPSFAKHNASEVIAFYLVSFVRVSLSLSVCVCTYISALASELYILRTQTHTHTFSWCFMDLLTLLVRSSGYFLLRHFVIIFSVLYFCFVLVFVFIHNSASTFLLCLCRPFSRLRFVYFLVVFVLRRRFSFLCRVLFADVVIFLPDCRRYTMPHMYVCTFTHVHRTFASHIRKQIQPHYVVRGRGRVEFFFICLDPTLTLTHLHVY